METKLIALYLLICRLHDNQPVLKQQRLSDNHQSVFSDEELLPANSGLFADKAYFHAATEAECKEHGSFVVASYKRHRNESQSKVTTLYNRFVSVTRQPLESLFGWIIQKTDLQNASRVPSTQGLKVHCYGTLAVACLLLTFYS